jgi:lon-related putative ATP-dependent protease
MPKISANEAVMREERFELSPAELAFAVDFAAEAGPEAASPTQAEAGPATAPAAAEKSGAIAAWGSSVIGQPRALEALRMGVRIRAKGYNVYVSGAPGTGRRTAVLRVLADEPEGTERLRDIGFVYDFEAPLAPRILRFQAGKGREFRRDLHRLVESMKEIVRLQIESEAQKKTEAELGAALEKAENERLSAFETELAADGFRAIQVVGEEGRSAMDIVPLVPAGAIEAEEREEEEAETAEGAQTEEAGPAPETVTDSGPEAIPAGEAGEPVEFEETTFEKLQDLVAAGRLAEADYNALRTRWYGHMDRMRSLFAELRRGRGELEERLRSRREEIMAPQVSAETRLLAQHWPDPAVGAWLAALEKDVLGHLWLFQDEMNPRSSAKRRRSPALARYGINLVIDRSGATRAPVIVENHPSLTNLFGFVEPKPEEEGDTRTAYLRIRAGTYLQASGGYLVLRAEDVLADEETWVRLKRALQDGKVEIQPREGPYGAAAWLKPEAVPADVKVILVGGEGSYDALYQADPDFQKLFKIHAEFDSSMPRSPEGLRDYAAFVDKIVQEEGLLPVSPEGLGAVAEEGVRLAEYRRRLSTRFGLIADLLREADYRARINGRPTIGGESIRGAVAARAHLANLPEEKIEEMIVSGEIILQVEGRAQGRVNGLAVHDRGYYAFGLPAVISAQVSPGESGVINIEGESGLSGEIYDKAVLIVEGFLRSRYARDFPLAVTASICFEQSYTAVEGDSASSTAVYALLSAISGVPLRQDIAVSGSLNQIGQVQPVGGVNEKIEGFWRVCKQAGLTGSQGVMIPRRNVGNLVLPREIQEAVGQGRFHVWAVSSIDEGIEVLTGMEAGAPNERGEFPPDSFNGKVRKELQKMAKTIKNFLG